MTCPACARPIAVARANCAYCGAALSEDVLAEAAQAAQRVLQSKTLTGLEAAATGLLGTAPPRRYIIVDTAESSVETLVSACRISVWEAKQWQAASRYRLVKITTEPGDGPIEAGFRQSGLKMIVAPEESVVQSRNPLLAESINPSSNPVECTLRAGPEAPPARRLLPEEDLLILVSGFIRREKVKDQTSFKTRTDTRLEDAWIVHLHFRGEPRPWEIDARRTGYEGAGLASAHMQTMELVRRLGTSVPHDDSFRNVVPALAPGVDPTGDFAALKSGAKSPSKEPKRVVLDNLAQFREYSAWRGAAEQIQPSGGTAPPWRRDS